MATAAAKILGTLRSNDADGNENVKRTIGLKSKTTTLQVPSHLFCTFLSRLCTTATWKCLISRFLKDVMKQRRNYIPLFELGYGHLKFSFRRVRLHLTKHVGRNNRYEDWKNANSFSLLLCRWMLKFLTSPLKGLCRFFFQTLFRLFRRALNLQM